MIHTTHTIARTHISRLDVRSRPSFASRVARPRTLELDRHVPFVLSTLADATPRRARARAHAFARHTRRLAFVVVVVVVVVARASQPRVTTATTGRRGKTRRTSRGTHISSSRIDAVTRASRRICESRRGASAKARWRIRRAR